ncbi:hypothetical protein J4G33_08675 [Actinotalea sp. BY-33]|uniref:Uncharacterized protein n=1 Tax=Actinotalea soli TaxID=2819234 RepID=A0A939LQ14_9CELL|nr:hypothetical protein [Actinotalea soli]MBO1751874.1 hypothetical protein [Actinotalea soli]
MGSPAARPARPDLPVLTGARRRALLPADQREQVDTAEERLPPAARGLVHRMLAAGASVGAVEGLASVWSGLGRQTQAAVLDPLRIGPALRQQDGTTCGSAVLTMLAATGDPALALWLASGTLLVEPGGRPHLPPELARATAEELDGLARRTVTARAAALHRAAHRATTTARPPTPPWPRRWGTPPWGAAAVARWVGLRFAHRPVTGTGSVGLQQAAHALDAGGPVLLYSGGRSAVRGPAPVLPRHVVLVLPAPQGPVVWEPAGGRTCPATGARLVADALGSAALGGWRHSAWVVLPR